MPRATTLRLLLLACTILAAGSAPAELRIEGKARTDKDDYQKFIRFLTVPPDKQKDAAFDGKDVRSLEDPLRREIVDKMIATPDVFPFDSTADAEKNILLRLLVIKCIRDMNAGRTPFAYPGDGTTFATKSDRWEIGAPDPFAFRLKRDQPARAGIQDLLKKETAGECSGAIIACLYWAAAEVLKGEFDDVHKPGSLVLTTGGEIEKHRYEVKPALKLLARPTDHVDDATHVPGDQVYLKNADYDVRAKAQGKSGFWSGINLIYVGDGSYTGLGVAEQCGDCQREDLRRHYNEAGLGRTLDQKTAAKEITARVKRPTVLVGK